MTAPFDEIRCQIKKEHKNWAEAELLEILKPSHLRVEPLCPHYGQCGGCSLQHLDYEAQVEIKTAILRDVFSRIGGFIPREIKVRKSAPFEYRNRMRFHKTNGNCPGFRERKNSRLVQLNDCPVAESGIRKALQSGVFVLPQGKEKFSVFSLSRQNIFLSSGAVERGRLSVLGKKLTMDVNVFFQSNIDMLEKLVQDIMTTASSADRALPMADIYSGVGTFSSFLYDDYQGKSFPECDMVEENKAALALARKNMPAGRKVNYYPMTDTRWSQTSNRRRPFGFMILDPPRKGLSSPLMEYLALSGPELVSYVSCDPATLARDSRHLLESGYELKELIFYDFYPQTAHIESLAVFGREKR
jgi:23S rRNA (uracil1939-C5)-methyltransferase